MEGSRGCQGAVARQPSATERPNFAMRQFEVEPGGHTPKHSHDYEHEVFVLEGAGVAVEGDREQALAAGDVVFVKPNEVHQFRNTGSAPLKFLVLDPQFGRPHGD